MSPVPATAHALVQELAHLTESVGRRVALDAEAVLDRSADFSLSRPGRVSANRTCRLFRAADGWLALNLAREDDRRAVPALTGCGLAAEPWRAVARRGRDLTVAEWVARGRLLGMPLAGVGEVTASAPTAVLHGFGAPGPRTGPLKVVDLSSLWAGPLCGAILAQMGAQVTKVESLRRPDTTRHSAPAFFTRLNGDKRQLALDFSAAGDIERLRALIAGADVVITSARPRAFDALGLSPARVFAQRPSLTWVAITGFGFLGAASDRVAFGDDAAAAGGLVRWTASGAPRFLGDAVADPLTGLAAAIGALRALAAGGGCLVDAALAQIAAGTVAKMPVSALAA